MKNLIVAINLLMMFLPIMPMEITGSGKIVQEDRKIIKDITNIKIHGSFCVTIEESDKEFLSIKADDNLLQYIVTELSGDTLIIKMDANFSTKNPIECNIGVKKLEKVSVSGSTTVVFTKNSKDDFFLEAYGSSTISGVSQAKKLVVNLSGSSSVTLEGQSSEQFCEGSGSFFYDAKKLLSDNITCNFSGAGHAKLFATNKIKGTLSGAVTLFYTGNAQVDVITRGCSALKKD